MLQADTRQALRRAFHDRPWELQAMRRLQPWALAPQLPNPDDLLLDARAQDGIEMHLDALYRNGVRTEAAGPA